MSRAAGGARALALLAVCVAAGGCRGGDERAPRSVVVITLDTTRADALTSLGGPAGLTPHLDAFAQGAVNYVAARTVAPLTMPAHASMFTGLYPPRHRVRDNNVQPLPRSASTLAERAREAGHATAAFVSSIALDRAFGIDQGFEVYDQPPRPMGNVTSHWGERVGSDTARLAAAWLEQRDRERPFLLWVHFMDPHAPYEPPPAFASRAAGDPYHGEVAAMDAAVGEVLAALDRTGGADEALVVIVGDHGESLGEHGEATHAAYCFDATIRVPFLVRHPRGDRAGERSPALVSVVDVFPTALGALGLEGAGDVDGVSLLHGDPALERGVYFESMYGWLTHGWSPLSGWADRKGTLLMSSKPLFLAPGGGKEGVVVARSGRPEYTRAIAEVVTRAVLPTDADERVDESVVRSLGGLGYAAVGEARGGWPGPFDDLDRPSPHDQRAELALTTQAMALSNAGQHGRAIEVLRRVLEDNPGNRLALDRLGNSLVLAQRYAEALPPLRRLCADGPPWAGSHYNLGVALFMTGAHTEAAQSFTTALGFDAGHMQSMDALMKVHTTLGNTAEAARWKRKLAELTGG